MKNTHYDFIDALRGYAIFAVIIVHVASALPPTAGLEMRLFLQGARGVQLFYIASALTLLMSWYSRNDGFVAFMIRRVFRILPMFWLVIPVYLLFTGLGSGYFSPAVISISGIVRSVFFVDMIYPSNDSVVPGGWTVNTEMIFYILFPLFVLMVNSWRKAIVVYMVFVLIVCKYQYIFLETLFQAFPKLPPSIIAVWGMYSLPLQLPVFLSGFIVFFLLRDPKVFPTADGKLILLLFVFSVFLMLALPFLPEIVPIYISYSLPLAILVFCFGRGVGGLLINKPIIALGKVSYSAYLWHFSILNLIYLCRDNGFDFVGINLAPSYFRFGFLLIIVTLILQRKVEGKKTG